MNKRYGYANVCNLNSETLRDDLAPPFLSKKRLGLSPSDYSAPISRFRLTRVIQRIAKGDVFASLLHAPRSLSTCQMHKFVVNAPLLPRSYTCSRRNGRARCIIPLLPLSSAVSKHPLESMNANPQKSTRPALRERFTETYFSTSAQKRAAKIRMNERKGKRRWRKKVKQREIAKQRAIFSRRNRSSRCVFSTAGKKLRNTTPRHAITSLIDFHLRYRKYCVVSDRAIFARRENRRISDFVRR